MATNVADLLRVAAAESPDATALVDTASGRRLTWAELDDEVDRVASGLSAMGLVAGYRVMLCLGNRLEFVTAYYAVLRARMVAVPVNPRSVTGELARMIANCGARVVLAEASTVASVRSATSGIADALDGVSHDEADDQVCSGAVVPRLVCISDIRPLPGECSYADLAAAQISEVPLAEDPEALAVLLYTSGTSGRPRAAMISHRALLSNVEQVSRVEPPAVTAGDVVLAVLPLFHVYGLNAVLGQCVHSRAAVVLVEGFDRNGCLDVIAAEGVTVVPVAPAALAAWATLPDLGERLSGVRLVLSGSAPLSPELAEDFSARTGVDLHQGYGLTEAAPVVTSTMRSKRHKSGSVGAAIPGVSLRLLDDVGAEVEGEDPGEIAVRGDNLFSGYWPDGREGPDRAGWWPTGDVGFLDSEGDLFLVDRVKELVIVSGFNVYPSEVEEVITEVAGVAEAAVIGVASERTGEAVVAYVRPTPDLAVSRTDLAQAVREHCATRLAGFKQPSEVRIVDELAHTVTGKVAKGRLRAAARQRALGLLA